MQLLLIPFPVIMLFTSVLSNNTDILQDLTKTCVNGRDIRVYLTSGVGFSDVSVVEGEGDLNCTLTYSSRPEHYILAVVEFPERTLDKPICTHFHKTVFMVRTGERNSCDSKSISPFKSPHYVALRSELSLHIITDGNVSKLKVIATSMRVPENNKCYYGREVECNVDRKIFCMSNYVSCDGHNNCIKENKYDEDEEMCKGVTLTPLVIIVSIAMGVITFGLILSVLLVLLPRRGETFLYKFEQSMTLFDSDRGHVHVEINVQVLFPPSISKPAELQLSQKKSGKLR